MTWPGGGARPLGQVLGRVRVADEGARRSRGRARRGGSSGRTRSVCAPTTTRPADAEVREHRLERRLVERVARRSSRRAARRRRGLSSGTIRHWSLPGARCSLECWTPHDRRPPPAAPGRPASRRSRRPCRARASRRRRRSARRSRRQRGVRAVLERGHGSRCLPRLAAVSSPAASAPYGRARRRATCRSSAARRSSQRPPTSVIHEIASPIGAGVGGSGSRGRPGGRRRARRRRGRRGASPPPGA